MRHLTVFFLLTLFSAPILSASEELGIPAEPAPLAGPIIELYGNGYRIFNGDATPDDYDLTDFEYVSVGDKEDHSFSIHNAGDADLILDGPLFVGLVGGEGNHYEVIYFPKKTLAPGAWSTFTIRFEPESSGEKITTVSIHSNASNDDWFAFNIHGDADGNLNWLVTGGCGTGSSMGFADALWIPFLILMVLALRRRTTSDA